MKTMILLSFLATAIAPALARAQNSVEVVSNRLRLGDIMPTAAADIADIDLGCAPEPGEHRVVSGLTVRAQLTRAGVDTKKLAIPRMTMVTRKAQFVSPQDVEVMAEREVQALLPQGLSISHVKAPRGVSLAAGAVNVELTNRPQLRAGFQTVMLDLRVEGSAARKVAVTLELTGETRQAATAIHRGDRVLIVAARNGLTLQLYGLAQNDGRVGDSVAVMPIDGNKNAARCA